MSPRRLTRPQLALLAIVAAGAAVRFSTLGVQSFWLDEGITVHILRMDFGGMLAEIPKTEQTPPVYYLVAWVWTQVFGSGEVGVRSLSALIGTVTIPVAYLLGRELLSRRAGLIAAALTAFSPLMVWYSQEVRAYALLVLLAGLSILLFVRALDTRRPRTLGHWAVVSALALATHYFALFIVLPQAAWLLLRAGPRRAVVGAVAAVGLAGAALIPLAIAETNHSGPNGGAKFIRGSSLLPRAVQVPKQYLIGYDAPAEVGATVAALLLAGLAAWLLLRRADARERRGAAVAAAFLAAAAGVPLLLAVLGADYLITRNLLAGWLPFALVLAAGFGARRAGLLGPLGAAALCAIGLAAVIAVDMRPEFQRDDWRGVARALGPPAERRAIVVSPVNGEGALAAYAPGLRNFPERPLAVREIDLVGVAVRRPGQTPKPPRRPDPIPPGYRVVERRTAPTFTLIRLRTDRPLPQTRFLLNALRLDPGLADFLIQEP